MESKRIRQYDYELVDAYVACDGHVFKREADCKNYEESCTTQLFMKAVDRGILKPIDVAMPEYDFADSIDENDRHKCHPWALNFWQQARVDLTLQKIVGWNCLIDEKTYMARLSPKNKADCALLSDWIKCVINVPLKSSDDTPSEYDREEEYLRKKYKAYKKLKDVTDNISYELDTSKIVPEHDYVIWYSFSAQSYSLVDLTTRVEECQKAVDEIMKL